MTSEQKRIRVGPSQQDQHYLYIDPFLLDLRNSHPGTTAETLQTSSQLQDHRASHAEAETLSSFTPSQQPPPPPQQHTHLSDQPHQTRHRESFPSTTPAPQNPPSPLFACSQCPQTLDKAYKLKYSFPPSLPPLPSSPNHPLTNPHHPSLHLNKHALPYRCNVPTCKPLMLQSAMDADPPQARGAPGAFRAERPFHLSDRRVPVSVFEEGESGSALSVQARYAGRIESETGVGLDPQIAELNANVTGNNEPLLHGCVTNMYISSHQRLSEIRTPHRRIVADGQIIISKIGVGL